MGETIGIRELKNNLSRVMERVETGEPITVTRRGKPVARIVSTTRSPGMEALIASGVVRPGKRRPWRQRKPVKLQGHGKTAAEYVSEGRR